MTDSVGETSLVALRGAWKHTMVAQAVARALNTDELIEFLKELDDKAASWDFTRRAAQMLNSTMREYYAEVVHAPDARVIGRVAEFTRQAGKIPRIESSEQIMGVWTDPHAAHAPLNLDDLRRLIELATVGADSLQGAKEYGDE